MATLVMWSHSGSSRISRMINAANSDAVLFSLFISSIRLAAGHEFGRPSVPMPEGGCSRAPPDENSSASRERQSAEVVNKCVAEEFFCPGDFGAVIQISMRRWTGHQRRDKCDDQNKTSNPNPRPLRETGIRPSYSRERSLL